MMSLTVTFGCLPNYAYSQSYFTASLQINRTVVVIIVLITQLF